MALLETKHLTFTYPEEERSALSQIDLTIQPGEFVVLCGHSGSGKSTLLRLLKRAIAPHGHLSGDIYYKGSPYSHLSDIDAAREIGMVFQDPENQIVMELVMDELVFGLENVGMETAEMRTRIAEMTHAFGLDNIIHRKTHELSGGQKQLINLASVMLLEPEILLLDEPTSQLDPVAAKEFLEMVHRMNDEFGLTVVIVEHRLEEVFALADRVVVLEHGEKLFDGPPRKLVAQMKHGRIDSLYPYLPSAAMLYYDFAPLVKEETIPLNVKEGRAWLSGLSIVTSNKSWRNLHTHLNGTTLIQAKEIDFQYHRKQQLILDRLNLEVFQGEWLAIVGANGTGKSTLLKVLAGLERPQRGTLKYHGKKMNHAFLELVGYLPQNPKLFFLQDTVEGELKALAHRYSIDQPDKVISDYLKLFGLETLRSRHPYDLSGGEMQKAALIGVLLGRPEILLIDEPTKGLDPTAKKDLGTLLLKLQHEGMTLVMVTHDVEFAAQYANRCAMMFQGALTSEAETDTFFRGNNFYTTTANRLTRKLTIPEVLTVEEAHYTWRVQN